MRRITVVSSDYSDGPIHGWTRRDEGFLINPRVVLESDQMGFAFLVFDEPIKDEQQSVDSNDATHYQIDIHLGKSVEHLDAEELAHMTVWQLGEYITGINK